MKPLPPLPSKTRQLRERYRKVRRRQFAMLIGVVLLCVVLAGVVVGTVIALRSCQAGPRPPRAPVDTAAAPAPLIKLLDSRRLSNAPWFVCMEGGRLYCAVDSQQREIGYPNFPVDMLECYQPNAKEAQWQVPVEGEFAWFGVSQNVLLGFRQQLSDPPRIELTAFSAVDGTQRWTAAIEGAGQGSVGIDGKVIAVGYATENGWRLAAYNLERGAKAWGIKLPLKGLKRDLAETEKMTGMELIGSSGVLLYRIGNVVGAVESNTGKRLREYAAPGLILQLQADGGARVAYLIAASADANERIVQQLKLDGGTPANLIRTATIATELRLLAAAGHVAVAYGTADAAGLPVAQLAIFRSGHAGAICTAELGPGVVEDMVALPDAPGGFLAALNEYSPDEDRPRGGSQLVAVRADAGVGTVQARLKRPVLYLVPFKQQCVALLSGGDVYSFDPAGGKLRRIGRTGLAQLDSVPGADAQHLLVIGYGKDYLAGKPGQPMQVLIYE